MRSICDGCGEFDGERMCKPCILEEEEGQKREMRKDAKEFIPGKMSHSLDEVELLDDSPKAGSSQARTTPESAGTSSTPTTTTNATPSTDSKVLKSEEEKSEVRTSSVEGRASASTAPIKSDGEKKEVLVQGSQSLQQAREKNSSSESMEQSRTTTAPTAARDKNSSLSSSLVDSVVSAPGGKVPQGGNSNTSSPARNPSNLGNRAMSAPYTKVQEPSQLGRAISNTSTTTVHVFL